MAQPQTEQILNTVSRFIVEVIGDELELEEPIGMDTSFHHDLELESIELVALSEKVQTHYGEDLDLAAWLATKELDEIIRLTVGELVELIATATRTSHG